MTSRIVAALALLALAAGCSGGGSKETPDAGSTLSPKDQALVDVKAFIAKNLDDLHDSAVELQAGAPAPDADGWNATADADAVARMRASWKKTRTAYEHVEGAIAVLFPDLDLSADDRYDGFLANSGPDDDLFDDQGVTGIHAIERILWSDQIPQKVITFESALPGYKAAAFPANAQEATEFHDKLCARLIADIDNMRDQFRPLALDPSAAYRGVIGSMKEQVEKANKAASGEEESRYAQYTLADMRINVSAGLTTYGAFKPWLLQQSNGAALDKEIQDGFGRVQAAYDAIAGDALPPVPSTWSSENPSATDLATPFGQLWNTLHVESDPNRSGSLVDAMDRSADALGIPALR